MATSPETTLELLRSTLKLEAQALLDLIPRVDAAFVRAVEMIEGVSGKVVFSGVGKSGLIARKAAATFSSTGTPAIFIHPTDGLHGDLGLLTKNDIVVAIGKTGETIELNQFVSATQDLGLKAIAISARASSTLAKTCALVLETPISQEACPLDLAPTSSTTVALALTDALAIALMKRRGFQAQDFAQFHPGGALGRKLSLRVSDVLIPLEKCGILNPETSSMTEVLAELNRMSQGLILLSNDGGKTLAGILTDGDIRRLLLDKKEAFLGLKPSHVMNPKPLTILNTMKGHEALRLMENRAKALNVLVVLTPAQEIAGIVRTHELI